MLSIPSIALYHCPLIMTHILFLAHSQAFNWIVNSMKVRAGGSGELIGVGVAVDVVVGWQ